MSKILNEEIPEDKDENETQIETDDDDVDPTEIIEPEELEDDIVGDDVDDEC